MVAVFEGYGPVQTRPYGCGNNYLESVPRPVSRAWMMASARSATWSLLKMLVMWLRTVHIRSSENQISFRLKGNFCQVSP